MEASKHSAPGQLAGYLFQPERALFWLAKCERGGVVGVETGDDVVLKGADGTKTYEQDKSTISSHRTPLTDRSEELWKTLSIWVEAVKSGEIQIGTARLVIATTAVLPSCLAKDLGKESKTPAEIAACIRQLRSTGAAPSATIASYTATVLGCSDQELSAIIERISVIDGSDGSSGQALKDKLLSELHIADHLPGDAILQSLYGWICDTLMQLWRNGKPGWITFEQFVRQLHQVIRLHERRTFRERARDLVPVSDEDRKSHRTRPFVKQLLLVLREDEEDILISAIDDFIRSVNERNRLSQQGNITREDLKAFDDRLHDRWQLIFKNITRKKSADDGEARERGWQVFSDTLDHREPLAGEPTEEHYLTRGSYHKLADLIRLGWHPDYKQRMQESDKT